MGREILVVWAARHRRPGWDRLCGRYAKRIARLATLREMPVKARGRGSGLERLRAEGQAILRALPDPCWSVALDRRGKARDSRQLAAWLERLAGDWPHPIAFVIGSDLGLAEEVLEGVREAVSLGPLTLPHELARLLLYEQLYRALSIAAGIKYHREPL